MLFIELPVLVPVQQLFRAIFLATVSSEMHDQYALRFFLWLLPHNYYSGSIIQKYSMVERDTVRARKDVASPVLYCAGSLFLPLSMYYILYVHRQGYTFTFFLSHKTSHHVVTVSL